MCDLHRSVAPRLFYLESQRDTQLDFQSRNCMRFKIKLISLSIKYLYRKIVKQEFLSLSHMNVNALLISIIEGLF